MLTAVISCKAEVDLSYYISELRENVYVGEVESLKVSVYPEKREAPFIADSYVGKLKNQLIVKIDNESSVIDDAEITLTYDNRSVSGSFEYSPIGGKYVCVIDVETLPSSASVNAVIKCSGKESQVVLQSAVNSDTISAKDAINSVKKQDGNTVDKLFNTQKVEAEIHVRIMSDGKRNYYYVGLVSKDGTYAYLVDGKTGEVLARKSNP